MRNGTTNDGEIIQAARRLREIQESRRAEDRAIPDAERRRQFLAVHGNELRRLERTRVVGEGAVAGREQDGADAFGDRSVLACRYAPPGNIDGRRAY